MKLFLKGLIIGIGKIIPGVSGAMLAINFKVYEKAIDAITNFFSDWKDNLKFLLLLGFGIIVSILLCSNLVGYFLNNYYFLTMMLFIGLILGGTYNFSKNIRFSFKDIGVIFLVTLLVLFISVSNINYEYIIRNSFMDNIVFFLGGIIEAMAMVIPGISGTALLMVIGIYEKVIEMLGSIYSIKYVISNFNLYLSYGFGMMVSFIFSIVLVNYFLKRFREESNLVILGLSTASILLLGIMTFSCSFTLIEFILGVMLLSIGLLISSILDK